MSWFKSIFNKGETATSVAQLFDAPLQPKGRIAVIGDVHGRIDLLDALLAKLPEDGLDAAIFVGDLVDRGDSSAEVLSRVFDLTKSDPRIICLKGNHEKMLLDFLDRPEERGPRWLKYGGLQTLASFGLQALSVTMTEDEFSEAVRDFRRVLPDGMEDWLRGLPTSWNSGNLWVVHAAADPDVPLSEQNDRVLMWGHKAFRHKIRSDGNWVAYGHTIVERPEAVDGRIGVDTGAYATGRLTAALISPDGDVAFLQS